MEDNQGVQMAQIPADASQFGIFIKWVVIFWNNLADNTCKIHRK